MRLNVLFIKKKSLLIYGANYKRYPNNAKNLEDMFIYSSRIGGKGNYFTMT